MENNMEGEHWCNICSKMVNPLTEAENKCPFCETEFAEVVDNLRDQNDAIDLRMLSESENTEDNRNIDSSILVIDPFNEGALVVRGPNLNHTSSPNENSLGSLNDFVVGSGFDLLLQHLAQIGPSGYASVNPPAQKAAIEAMPSVINDEKLQCTICLEDLEIGSEAKEMPFCRFQMPYEDSAVEADLGIGNGDNQNNELVRAREERTRNGRRNWFPVLQSFNNFLPSP
ncbi:hypothetical protein SESBI_28787 [Sesbania bispinosa]|nr:hypothetical protein SESBI_28787 [Sesbania bispinosa]